MLGRPRSGASCPGVSHTPASIGRPNKKGHSVSPARRCVLAGNAEWPLTDCSQRLAVPDRYPAIRRRRPAPKEPEPRLILSVLSSSVKPTIVKSGTPGPPRFSTGFLRLSGRAGPLAGIRPRTGWGNTPVGDTARHQGRRNCLRLLHRDLQPPCPRDPIQGVAQARRSSDEHHRAV